MRLVLYADERQWQIGQNMVSNHTAKVDEDIHTFTSFARRLGANRMRGKQSSGTVAPHAHVLYLSCIEAIANEGIRCTMNSLTLCLPQHSFPCCTLSN